VQDHRRTVGVNTLRIFWPRPTSQDRAWNQAKPLGE